MGLIERIWKPRSQIHTYFRLLEENFQVRYSSTPVKQLPEIAVKLMPELPEEVFGWPEETLHAILGELAFFSKPEILNRAEIASLNLVCSNQEYVDLIQFLHKRGDTKTLLPALIEHTPNHIIRVIDTTICKRASFCPEHPGHRIIYQSLEERWK